MSGGSQMAKRKTVKAKPEYVIPHFDFDQPEIYEGPPDPDEVCIN